MPSYVRRRLLSSLEVALSELAIRQEADLAYPLSILESLRQAVRFNEFWLGGIDMDGCEPTDGLILATNAADDLIKEYRQARYHEIDPLIQAVSRSNPVVSWQDVVEKGLSSPRLQLFHQHLKTYNVLPRTLVSFWNQQGKFYGGAVFTREAPFSSPELTLLAIVSRHVHDLLSAPILSAFNAQICLNTNEHNCLQLASHGLTSEEIGQELGLTTETVNAAVKTATKRLQARNRPQAVADAIRLGIIF